jgi:hypothetical protein
MIHYNKLAFDFSPAPIVVLSNRHMVEMNHAFAQMFGHSSIYSRYGDGGRVGRCCFDGS